MTLKMSNKKAVFDYLQAVKDGVNYYALSAIQTLF